VEVDVTLLIAAGEIADDNTLVASCQVATRVIAVDGGVRHLRLLNIVPDIIVGDFDSATDDDIEWAENEGAEIIRLDGQNESDLTKALKLCAERGWTEVMVNGVEGGRADHQLAVIAALADADSSLDIRTHLNRTFVFRFVEGFNGTFTSINTFSLFALSDVTISLEDCEWELENEKLGLSTRGLSNKAEGDVRLTVHSGGPIFAFINL
jgi:thiamine pyrophosphokinase